MASEKSLGAAPIRTYFFFHHTPSIIPNAPRFVHSGSVTIEGTGLAKATQRGVRARRHQGANQGNSVVNYGIPTVTLKNL